MSKTPAQIAADEYKVAAREFEAARAADKSCPSARTWGLLQKARVALNKASAALARAKSATA